MKGRQIHYSAEELAWLKDRKVMPRRDLYRKWCKKFDRDDVSFQNLKALMKRKGWMTGRTGQYPKGNVPENKGKKMPFNPNSAATQFKKGSVPANREPIGHERIDNKDGYIYIKIDEINPHTGFRGRYVHKHRHLWEKKHGPIADDMVLKCSSGDKTDCDPSNWKRIPRAMLPRLNGRFGRNYDTAPAEIKPTIMAIAELEHKGREIQQPEKCDD